MNFKWLNRIIPAYTRAKIYNFFNSPFGKRTVVVVKMNEDDNGAKTLEKFVLLYKSLGKSYAECIGLIEEDMNSIAEKECILITDWERVARKVYFQ